MEITHFPSTFTDQLGNKIQLERTPQRIVSLVPSQTELLLDLGLENRVVGITKFCIHPKVQVKSIPKVGGTKNFDFDLIHQLQPDLIIGNKEENYQEGIQFLQARYPVWLSDIITLKDALDMITGIGQLTDTAAIARNITDNIKGGFNNLVDFPLISAAYFIWRKPYMVAGCDTFIQEILKAAGFLNVFAHEKRYPVINAGDLQKVRPKLILLSSEPYPFQEKHIAEMQQICPTALIKIVDGEVFSWYGSRLQYAPAYIKNLRNKLATALN
jgi:ABC-type Fe3+-hydroxamate transport system substrate-binding protein